MNQFESFSNSPHPPRISFSPNINEEEGLETIIEQQHKAQRLERTLDSNIDKPLEDDVLLGRGAHAFHHEGNKRWKQLTMIQADRYYTSKRHEKRRIAENIVQQVHARNGRFLSQEKTTGKYCEIHDKEATLKTSQLFRDFRYSKEKNYDRILHPVAAANVPPPKLTTTVPYILPGYASNAPPSTANGGCILPGYSSRPQSSIPLNTLVGAAAAKEAMHRPGPNSSPSFPRPPLTNAELLLKYPSLKPSLLHGKEEKGAESMREYRKTEVLGLHDVLCGGAQRNQHVGNRNYRKMVEDLLLKYIISESYTQERVLVEGIVEEVQKRGGRFLRKDATSNDYAEMSDKEAIQNTELLFTDLALERQRLRKKEKEKEERKAKGSEPKFNCSSQSDRIIRRVIPSCRESGNDVLYGNGAHVDHHLGNIRYRKLVKDALIKHFSTDNYIENYKVADVIVKKVQENGGRFLKRDATTNEYAVMCDGDARTMTIDLFKDCKPAQKKEQKGPESMGEKKDNTEGSEPKLDCSNQSTTLILPDLSCSTRENSDEKRGAAMADSTTKGSTKDQVLLLSSDSAKHDISQQANTPATQCNGPQPLCVVSDGSATVSARTTKGSTKDQVLLLSSDSSKHDIFQQTNMPATQCNGHQSSRIVSVGTVMDEDTNAMEDEHALVI